MSELPWRRKLVVVEPVLEFDLKEFSDALSYIRPQEVYIGYDNYGNKLPEPPLEKTLRLIEESRKFTDVHAKSLRRAWYENSSR